MNAVEVSNLRKSYGKLEALRGADLVVPSGGIYGLVGPNGAGKTSLIKTLVGAVRPTAGTVRVLNLDPLRDRWKLRQQVGYMPQSSALYEDLSAQDNILFYGRGQNVSNLKQKVKEILEFTELDQRASHAVRTFSGGMKKRVSLACALIHKPQLLFLDEPTAAVDPHLRGRSWELFRQLAAQGSTLLISTHLMEEALLCDKVTILRLGQIVAVDTPEHLLQQGQTELQIAGTHPIPPRHIPSTPEALAQALHPHGLSADIHAIHLKTASLEEIVLNLIAQQTPTNHNNP